MSKTYSLKKAPRERRWWRPWDRWSTVGDISSSTAGLSIDQPDAPTVRIDLSQPFQVYLQAWPAKPGSATARVSMEIRQNGTELEIQTELPWSAVPEETPFKMSRAPLAEADAFFYIWTELRNASQMLDQRALPALEPGLYSGDARHPDLSDLPVEERAALEEETREGWDRPGLGDLDWVGTKHAIFTFGANTRGWFVVGINCEGVFVLGFNCKGVIVVGFNGVASLFGIGFNMASPAVLIGFNLLSPLVLIGFNAVTPDVTGTVGIVVRCIMSTLLFFGLGAVSIYHFRAAKKIASEKVEDKAGRVSYVLHRWHAWGYLLGSLVSLACIALWIAMPDLPQQLYDLIFG